MLISEQLSFCCDGFCGASEQEAGARFICKLADGNLERESSNILELIALRVEARRNGFVAYECTTRQNATLTGQGRQGGVELKVC